MAQDRKVFVGGVPQDLNQDDLYAIFSEYAGVKKAWLQKCRTPDDGSRGNTCPPQNHRGFGFVIFHDAHAIDELLGTGASRFIVLRSGAKLEVKRAISSNKMGQDTITGVAGQVQGIEAVGRARGQQQAAFRGITAADLPSSHVVGSAGPQRGQPTGPAGALRGGARGPGPAVQRAAAVQGPASAPWQCAGADNAVLRQLLIPTPPVTALQAALAAPHREPRGGGVAGAGAPPQVGGEATAGALRRELQEAHVTAFDEQRRALQQHVAESAAVLRADLQAFGRRVTGLVAGDPARLGDVRTLDEDDMGSRLEAMVEDLVGVNSFMLVEDALSKVDAARLALSKVLDDNALQRATPTYVPGQMWTWQQPAFGTGPPHLAAPSTLPLSPW